MVGHLGARRALGALVHWQPQGPGAPIGGSYTPDIPEREGYIVIFSVTLCMALLFVRAFPLKRLHLKQHWRKVEAEQARTADDVVVRGGDEALLSGNVT